ncbi:undecaprenyl pyrophosphate synthase [Lactococcus lactis subsp. lactis]|uniref:Undecaprenyl pyrophosphate synthase n=5 Tax=Lactococcus lactis TaxID=1358 RepID=A0A0B8QMT8_LACLL|nr:undecaprenyl pyrophosphate synthase [Lactococcus lactis subsp. lactis]
MLTWRTRKMTKFEEEVSNLPVSIITNYGDYWNKAQLLTVFKDWQPQQALPVVPEFVAEWIEILKTKGLKPLKNPETYGETGFTEEKLQNIVFWISEHQEDYLRAWLDGYTVEKPQLFYIELPKVFGLSDSTSDSTFVSKAESGIISEFTKGKVYALKLTEQEIKSIDERYWQFAVPVEDGE